MGDYTHEEKKRIEAMKKKIKDLEKQRVDDIHADYMWKCTVENCVVDGKIDELKRKVSDIKSSAHWRWKYGE